MPQAEQSLSLGVVVRTYARPQHLQRCLAALAAQTVPCDDVIVVFRQTDTITAAALEQLAPHGLPLRRLRMTVPDLVVASNAGLDACRTDLLAFIDDDTAPHPDWAARARAAFAADPALGGLGGRDHVHDGTRFDDRTAGRVGIVEWWGRVIGNHHLGVGGMRPVQVLKGANMIFRARALVGVRFDNRLRGAGMQPHEDVALSRAVSRRGWKLGYDPAVGVDHYAGRSDRRPYSSFGVHGNAQACRDSSFNIVVALWDDLSPTRKLAFAVWSVLIGSGADPGLVQAIRYTPRAGLAAWHRYWLTLQGKAAAYAWLTRHARTAEIPLKRPTLPAPSE